MKQTATPRYLLVGSGRLASHLEHFFSLKGIPLALWSRRENRDFDATYADVVLLAIADPVLPEFIGREELAGKTVVHFAGSRYFEKAWGFHPLMTFSHRLYDLAGYEKIPFIADPGFPKSEIFPFLSNPVYEIAPAARPLYHALCHMTGNFPALLWVHIFKAFEKDLKLPRALLQPFAESILQNTISDQERALAGPLARHDLTTIEKHKAALADHPSLHAIYGTWTDWALTHTPEENAR